MELKDWAAIAWDCDSVVLNNLKLNNNWKLTDSFPEEVAQYMSSCIVDDYHSKVDDRFNGNIPVVYNHNKCIWQLLKNCRLSASALAFELKNFKMLHFIFNSGDLQNYVITCHFLKKCFKNDNFDIVENMRSMFVEESCPFSRLLEEIESKRQAPNFSAIETDLYRRYILSEITSDDPVMDIRGSLYIYTKLNIYQSIPSNVPVKILKRLLDSGIRHHNKEIYEYIDLNDKFLHKKYVSTDIFNIINTAEPGLADDVVEYYVTHFNCFTRQLKSYIYCPKLFKAVANTRISELEKLLCDCQTVDQLTEYKYFTEIYEIYPYITDNIIFTFITNNLIMNYLFVEDGLPGKELYCLQAISKGSLDALKFFHETLNINIPPAGLRISTEKKFTEITKYLYRTGLFQKQ